jgi:phosphohistidine phosphatase
MIGAMAAQRNSILLYVVRHGVAHSQGEDGDRSLTDTGHDEIDVMARWAAGAGVEPVRIRHSGKRRAEQTASILQDRLAAEEGVVAAAGLAPDDDVRIVAESLKTEERSLMLVSHLPFVSRLTSFLLLQDSDRELLDFPTGAIACLARTGQDWRLIWLVTPALARR